MMHLLKNDKWCYRLHLTIISTLREGDNNAQSETFKSLHDHIPYEAAKKYDLNIITHKIEFWKVMDI